MPTDPQSPEELIEQAHLDILRHQPDEARRLLNAALQADPGNAEAARMLAGLAEREAVVEVPDRVAPQPYVPFDERRSRWNASSILSTALFVLVAGFLIGDQIYVHNDLSGQPYHRSVGTVTDISRQSGRHNHGLDVWVSVDGKDGRFTYDPVDLPLSSFFTLSHVDLRNPYYIGEQLNVSYRVGRNSGTLYFSSESPVLNKP